MRTTTKFTRLAAVALFAACSSGDAGQPAAEQEAAAAQEPAMNHDAPAAAPAAPAAVGGTKVAVEGGGQYTDVTVNELQAMLASKDFPLINVHVPFEGDLPNTDDSIPFDQIEQFLDKLPADKASKIVLYCRSGRMSAIAAEVLAKRGYTDVYNVTGGFNAWKAAGMPMAGG